MGRRNIVPELEKKLGSPLKPWLAARINEGKSPEEIAKALEIGKSKAYELISEMGLKDAVKAAKSQKKSGGQGELKHYIDDYLAEKRRSGLSEKTIRGNADVFDNYIWWLDNFHKPTDLKAIRDVEIIREFENYLTTQKNRFGREFETTVKRGTLKAYRKNLHALAVWLKKMDIISKDIDPFSKMMAIKMPKTKPPDIPDNIIQKALDSYGEDSFIDVRNKTLLEWFLETGQREGGVAGIKLNHFNWETGVGTVTEKGNKERTIVLSERLKTQVKKYMEKRSEISKCDYLFITKHGERLDEKGLYHAIIPLNKVCEKEIREAGCDKFHPHIFRHIWAKHLAISEVPLFAIMVMGGWENLKLIQTYAAAYTQEKAWSYINTASPLSKIKGV